MVQVIERVLRLTIVAGRVSLAASTVAMFGGQVVVVAILLAVPGAAQW